MPFVVLKLKVLTLSALTNANTFTPNNPIDNVIKELLVFNPHIKCNGMEVRALRILLASDLMPKQALIDVQCVLDKLKGLSLIVDRMDLLEKHIEQHMQSTSEIVGHGIVNLDTYSGELVPNTPETWSKTQNIGNKELINRYSEFMKVLIAYILRPLSERHLQLESKICQQRDTLNDFQFFGSNEIVDISLIKIFIVEIKMMFHEKNDVFVQYSRILKDIQKILNGKLDKLMARES